LRLFKYLQIGERVNKNDQDTKNTNNTKWTNAVPISISTDRS
jgi:hypothetical protein